MTSNKCKGTSPGDVPCGNWASYGSEWCFSHDPDKGEDRKKQMNKIAVANKASHAARRRDRVICERLEDGWLPAHLIRKKT